MIRSSLVFGVLVIFSACVSGVVLAQTWPATATTFPSNYVSPSAPSFVQFNTALYLAYRGTDSSIFLASSVDGDTWPLTPKSIGFGTSITTAAPALFASSAFIGVAFITSQPQPTSNVMVSVSSDGASWPAPVSLPYFAATPPSFTFVDPYVYMVFQGADGGVYAASSTDGLTWPATPTTVVGAGSTSLAPAIGYINGLLVVVYTSPAGNSLSSILSTCGLVWGGQSNFPSSYVPASAPVLAASQSSLYVMYRQADFKMYWAHTESGLTWSDPPVKILPIDSTALKQSLQPFGSQFALAFHSQTTNNLLFALTT